MFHQEIGKILFNKSEEAQLTFEYIDKKEKLVLPLFFKALIDNASNENIEKYNKKTTTIRMNDGRYVYICYYIHAPTQLVAPKAVTMAALSKCRFLRSKMIGRTGTLIFL